MRHQFVIMMLIPKIVVDGHNRLSLRELRLRKLKVKWQSIKFMIFARIGLKIKIIFLKADCLIQLIVEVIIPIKTQNTSSIKLLPS